MKLIMSKFAGLALILSVFIGGHFLSKKLAGKVYGLIGLTKVPYGSYGTKSSFLPKKGNLKRVLFLGNSVMQGTNVGRMLSKKIEHKFQLSNLSLTGSSVADYLFLLNHVAKSEYDYLVIHISPVTLGSIYPILFRSDLKFLLFRKENWNILKIPEVLEDYSKEDFARSLFYSSIPMLYSNYLAKCLGLEKLRPFIDPIFKCNINLPGDWAKSAPKDQKLNFAKPSQFQHARKLFKELLKKTAARKVSTLFIIQENNYEPTPIMGEIESLIENNPGSTFLDFSHHYSKDNFSDKVHPNKKGLEKYSQRLTDAILKFVNNDI